MKRIDHDSSNERTVKTVSRKDFDDDFKHGYVCLEFNPEREIIIKDKRSGREIRRVELADIVFRCVHCQFDNMDKAVIEKHLAMGEHPWSYNPFENPYGNVGDVVIEGIEDYAAFLADKEKR